MTNPIDKVARALHRAHFERGRRLYPDTWDQLDRFEREDWRYSAIAALRAIREPTYPMVEAMVQAAGQTLRDGEWMFRQELAFHAAIDKALES
jgi:hypothetical protein